MIYYADGYTINSNPSNTGGGYTVVDENNKLIEEKEFLIKGFTNNEAELRSALAAIAIASHNDTVIIDSMNTFYWIRSGNPKARPDLKELCSSAKRLARQKNISIIWKPREENLAGHYNERMKKDGWVKKRNKPKSKTMFKDSALPLLNYLGI